MLFHLFRIILNMPGPSHLQGRSSKPADALGLMRRYDGKILDVERHPAVADQPHHSDRRFIIVRGKGRDRVLRRFLHLPDAGRFPTDGSVEPQE